MTRPLGIILAGGQSERLGGAYGVEKPLVLLNSAPIVLHVARGLSLAGVRRIVVLTGENHEAILHGLGMESEFGVLSEGDTALADLEIRRSGVRVGTGGRLQAIAAHELSESALISYTDVLSDAPLQDLVTQLQDTPAAMSLLAVNPREPWGALDLQRDTVAAFHEKRTNRATWINGGVLAVTPDILGFIEHESEMLEVEPMARMIAASRVVATRHSGWWTSVDTPKDVRMVRASAEARIVLAGSLNVSAR